MSGVHVIGWIYAYWFAIKYLATDHSPGIYLAKVAMQSLGRYDGGAE